MTSRTGRWLLAAAVVGLAALATWNSVHKSLWIDEAYTEYTTRLPLLAAIHRSWHYELQPPLYFAVLDVWRDINRSVMFGRALSTLAAVAFVLVMAAIGRRLGLRRWWWLGIAAAAVPAVAWAASELRGYALVMLLVALTFYFYTGIVLGKRVAWADGAGYVLTAVALLYTFYYGGFVLAAQWLGALVIRRRVAALTGLLALVGCTLVPIVREITMNVATHPLDMVPVSLFRDPRYALFRTAGTAIGVFEGRAEITSWPHIMPIVAAIAVGVPVLRTLVSSVPWDQEEVMLAIAGLIPLAILALLRVFNLTPVHPQHMVVGLPGLLLIYGVWVQRMAAGWPRAVTGTVLAGGLIICLVSYERHNLQREDWRGAARYVAAHAQPTDVVLMYDPDRTLPFDDYFTSISRGIPVRGLPMDMDLEHYDPSQYVIRDTAAVAARIAALDAGQRPVWFVTSTRLLDVLKDGPAEVIAYLQIHDRLDPPVLFDGVRIIHAEPR